MQNVFKSAPTIKIDDNGDYEVSSELLLYCIKTDNKKVCVGPAMLVSGQQYLELLVVTVTEGESVTYTLVSPDDIISVLESQGLDESMQKSLIDQLAKDYFEYIASSIENNNIH